MSQSASVSDTPQKRRNVVARHPNASVAFGSGSGVGALTVWLIGLSGAQVSPELSAVVAGTAAWVALVVGRRGIKGSFKALWDGSGS
jgi:hypothetical protein